MARKMGRQALCNVKGAPRDMISNKTMKSGVEDGRERHPRDKPTMVYR